MYSVDRVSSLVARQWIPVNQDDWICNLLWQCVVVLLQLSVDYVGSAMRCLCLVMIGSIGGRCNHPRSTRPSRWHVWRDAPLPWHTCRALRGWEKLEGMATGIISICLLPSPEHIITEFDNLEWDLHNTCVLLRSNARLCFRGAFYAAIIIWYFSATPCKGGPNKPKKAPLDAHLCCMESSQTAVGTYVWKSPESMFYSMFIGAVLIASHLL